jgi:hypothetical protein
MSVNQARSFDVLHQVRKITNVANQDTLDNRKFLGVPLANEIRRWLTEAPTHARLEIDLRGVRSISASVAEELGPLLMQTVEQTPGLEHRYPIYRLQAPEPAYTIHRAFVKESAAGLAIVVGDEEPAGPTFILERRGSEAVVVLGDLSAQMREILQFADRRHALGEPLTSDDLTALPFMEQVSAAARSKRLTELYDRRLLEFRDNPNGKVRLFSPAWRLEGNERHSAA